jgi:adenylate cyclase, class 2
MAFINVEIKAITDKTSEIRDFLHMNNAEFKGIDEQTDTYFNVANGRLKLRQGNIENNLIFYNRPDQSGPRQSDFDLMKIENGVDLLEMLTKALGVKVVVKKRREIYYIENVKFHLDSLDGLGHFVEIEAGNKTHAVSTDKLYEQCDFYMNKFGIKQEDLIEMSYSDLLLIET